MEVSHSTFEDPTENMLTQLKVDYTIDGVAGSKTLVRGATLRISAGDKPGVAPRAGFSKLVIRKAKYGDLPNGESYDVTDVLTSMVRNDKLDVAVNNDSFGDPAPEKFKKIKVDFEVNGVAASRTIPEDGTPLESRNQGL